MNHLNQRSVALRFSPLLIVFWAGSAHAYGVGYGHKSPVPCSSYDDCNTELLKLEVEIADNRGKQAGLDNDLTRFASRIKFPFAPALSDSERQLLKDRLASSRERLSYKREHGYNWLSMFGVTLVSVAAGFGLGFSLKRNNRQTIPTNPDPSTDNQPRGYPSDV